MVSRVLSSRFAQALTYAAEAHAAQLKKGTSIPYISHLLAVCAIVLEHGGTEAEAIAALLHDAVEDAGGMPRLADIRVQFGQDVALIVEGCTESTDQTLPWRRREMMHLRKLGDASPGVALVCGADKLHNARSIAADLRLHGVEAWAKLKAGREGTLWYYASVADRLRNKVPPTLMDALDEAIDEMDVQSAPDSSDTHSRCPRVTFQQIHAVVSLIDRYQFTSAHYIGNADPELIRAVRKIPNLELTLMDYVNRWGQEGAFDEMGEGYGPSPRPTWLEGIPMYTEGVPEAQLLIYDCLESDWHVVRSRCIPFHALAVVGSARAITLMLREDLTEFQWTKGAGVDFFVRHTRAYPAGREFTGRT
jgi:hypothetical protein